MTSSVVMQVTAIDSAAEVGGVVLGDHCCAGVDVRCNRLAGDRDLPGRLAQGIPPIRTAADVAREMAVLYGELLPDYRPGTPTGLACDAVSST